MGIGRIARRTFLGLGGAAAGGLAVGYYLYRRPYPNPLEGSLEEGEYAFTPYVIVSPEAGVTIIAPRAESVDREGNQLQPRVLDAEMGDGRDDEEEANQFNADALERVRSLRPYP